MARWLLVNSSVLASFWLYTLVLLQAGHGGTAPTQHLTVSVEGNTPTLIVTSAEIGITPKIVHATATRTTPPHTAPASNPVTERSSEQLYNKSNFPKLKGKSHKVQYGKKWQHAARGSEKGKEKTPNKQETFEGATTGTVATIDGSATISSIPAKLTIQTVKPATTTSKQRFEESTTVAALVKENITESSYGSLASADFNTRSGNELSAPDAASTTDAIVSAAPGNLPRSSEGATEITLASTTAAATSGSIPSQTAGRIIEEALGVTSFEGADATRLPGIGTDSLTTPRITTMGDSVTATPTFMELHDTTAAETTKATSTAAPTTRMTIAAAMDVAKKPISATTSNASLIVIQIETLPKAITVTTTTTTTTPAKTTIPAEMATSAAFTTSNHASPTEHQTAKTISATTHQPQIMDKVVGVSQSVPTMSTSYSAIHPIVNTSIERGSSTNAGDNHFQSRILPSGEVAVAISRQPVTNATTPISGTETEQQTTTAISTTTAVTESLMVTKTKSVQIIQTTQKANTDSGIIFIDDVPDSSEGKQGEIEAELQRDEAVIDRHENIKDTNGDADDVSDSGGIIKLIDLEKHDIKSIFKAKQLRTSNSSHGFTDDDDDDGHDGVKKTKKKQLTDKHYLLLPDISVNAENVTPTIAPRRALVDTTYSFKVKNENKSGNNVSVSRSDLLMKTTKLIESVIADAHSSLTASSTLAPPHSHHLLNIEKSAAATPTLRPVHKGYLGPILMEEKRFTIMHGNKKPQQHHESTIESQLRNGHFVEILAPTALMEHTASAPKLFDTVANGDSTTPTTSVPPQVSATFAHAPVEQSAPMLSTTVFQVPESMISTTRLPWSIKAAHVNEEKSTLHQKLLPLQKTKTQKQQILLSAPKSATKQRTESKISDIQVEVYDSTVDSIVASTNFKDSDGFYALPLDAELETHIGTTKPPVVPQERFTQYVVDRADYSTQESSVAPHLSVASGKPEPAAIEIHINVSEGVGNESEDLEFSYRQPDFTGGSLKTNPLDEVIAKTAKAISMKPIIAISNESSARETIERGDEILVVEIIDTGENSTEGAISAENVNPIFTFRSDAESDIELKDIKYFPPEVKVKPPQTSDELFLADLKRENALPKPPLPPPPPPRKPTIDRDSDTIFYISNTEVKVGESLPTTNTDYEQQQQQQQLRKSRLESQFFPANYLASTHPNAAGMNEQRSPQQHRYEEDIILSPLRNTADSLKIFRSQSDGAPPLDVTYVGESVMEVEQSQPGVDATTTNPVATAAPPLMPDVIIQPAILPEMSIGVPVIGELPPQIELKEIDFMPDEANQQHSGMYENNMLEENGNGNGNDVDRLVESSIQYGGDLIDESAGGGGFDGVEGSYPFGNPAALQNKAHHEADYVHFTVNHGVSNLRKDELSADVPGSGELMVGQPAAAVLKNLENVELKELLAHSGNETLHLSMLANGSYVGASTERMSNATAYTVMDDPNAIELVFQSHYTLIIGIFIVLLPVVLTVSMTCALWYLYIKVYGSPNNREANQINGNATNGKKGGEGGSSQDESAIDTATFIPKQQLSFSTENPTNGNCFKSEQYIAQQPSSYTADNIICNGANGATFIRVDEKPDVEALLPAEGSVAIASLTSLSSSPKSGDNNKSKAQATNLSNNSVQENFTRPNGSVTKMTLKNNHLIVETEERHDISRVARQTTMHYNTSEKDGVFVVEVARGVDSKSMPGSPTTEEPRPLFKTPPAAAAATSLRSDEEKILKNHEEIQIHQPPPESTEQQPINCLEEIPERSLHQIVELEEPALSPHSFRSGVTKENTSLVRNFNTGLSQSDLSSTSSTDSNKRYSYGNQELYTIESDAYVSTTSVSTNLPHMRSTAINVAEDDDRRSENGHSLEHSPAAQGNGTPAPANDSNAACSELPKNEQLLHESNECVSERSDQDAQPVNIVLYNGIAEERISPEQESALGTAAEIGEAADGETVVEIKTELEKVETKAQPDDTQEGEVEEKRSIIEMVDEESSNNNSADFVGEQSELPVANDSDHNTVIHISAETENKTDAGDEEIDIKLLNGDDIAALTFPQPVICNYGYDSIISLPDPPSTEEIKQLADFAGVDSNQLDSLPPPSPPPPPFATDLNDNSTTTVHDIITTTTNSLTTEEESTTTQLKLNKLLHYNISDATVTEHCPLLLSNGNSNDTTNGNIVENSDDKFNVNGHQTINGHGGELLSEHLEHNLNAPPNTEDAQDTEDSDDTEANTGTDKVPDTTLTPPESPPVSSPVHYTNSMSALNGMNVLNRGICGGPLPVAVDVNGS